MSIQRSLHGASAGKAGARGRPAFGQAGNSAERNVDGSYQ